MSVLIKDIEMPKDRGVYIAIDIDGQAYAKPLGASEWQRLDQKAVLVPPHGDLIEESKVLDIVSEWCPDDDGSVSKDGDLREMLDEIEALPTIIEAEGEE